MPWPLLRLRTTLSRGLGLACTTTTASDRPVARGRKLNGFSLQGGDTGRGRPALNSSDCARSTMGLAVWVVHRSPVAVAAVIARLTRCGCMHLQMRGITHGGKERPLQPQASQRGTHSDTGKKARFRDKRFHVTVCLPSLALRCLVQRLSRSREGPREQSVSCMHACHDMWCGLDARLFS
jgi:hypothetical protein